MRIVDIDEESLRRLGQWPWSRDRVAALVERLHALGAATIAFDVLFAEPDRTSPARLAMELPASARSPELEQALGALPDHDALLAAEIANAGNVVLAVAFTNANDAAVPMPYTMPYGGTDPRRFLPSVAKGAVLPLPALAKAAAGLGSVLFQPDADGVERRVPLVFRENTVLVPSLAAEALRIAGGAHAIAIKASDASGEVFGDWRQQTGIVAIRIGPFTVPTDPGGRVWLHDTGHVAARFIPAWQVLEPDFDRGRTEGDIVFIGASAAGLGDIKATPLDRAAPGVEVHAQITEQIVLGDFLNRPDWARGAEFLFTLIFGVILIALVELTAPLVVSLCGVLAIGAAVSASWFAYLKLHFLLDPMFPSLTVLAVYLSASGLRFLASERERRWVRSAFSRYLSPVLVEQLAAAPKRLTLGGEMRDMTLMFCDVRGFTAISERLDPQGLTHLMNGFLTPMTGIVLDHRGTIDKYIGDCLMAFWNAPLDDPEHARHGAVAALRMAAAIPEINRRLAADAAANGREAPPIAVGIGLNTGPCCVGNMGSEQRFDYSALGDAVNLASRLEAQSKTYGVTIVVANDTLTAVPELAALELDLIRVKGKARPVRIFTVLGESDLAASPAFRTWRAAHDRLLACYRARQWDKARSAIAEARDAAGGTMPAFYDLYAERIRHFSAAEPPADWDGVYIAAVK